MNPKGAKPSPATPSLKDPQVRKRFEESLKRWRKRGKPVTAAVRSSERLTPQDFAIRINARS
jgi:hypothetical protein